MVIVQRMAGRLLILLVGPLMGCYSMQDEHALVLDSVSQLPVQRVSISKKPVRLPFEWGFPLPQISTAVTDRQGRAILRVPKNHTFFVIAVGSNGYELDLKANEPTTRPAGVDVIYYVRLRTPAAE
jgi:hypothetical protein